MSKIKLLLEVVSYMRSLADSIQAVADAMEGNEPVEAKEPTSPVKEPAPKKKEITLEEVRAKLAEKSQAGLTSQVREIIKKYGGSKLSEVDSKHYADMLKDAEVLGWMRGVFNTSGDSATASVADLDRALKSELKKEDLADFFNENKDGKLTKTKTIYMIYSMMSDYGTHRNENTIELPTVEDALFCLRLTDSILFWVYSKNR